VIVTLAWKEFREHRSIWLTMVVMTCVLGLGLAQIVSAGDPTSAIVTVTLAVLCMAGAYGAVCGGMMFAGEHEGGTLVFLDIFLGRRGLLWLGKAAFGVLLALSEGLAVAAVLGLFKQEAPAWAPVLVGQSIGRGGMLNAPAGVEIWFFALPIVTLEAYIWGLFGSALTRRVLSGAAIAAVAATPIWLIFVNAPAPLFLAVRLLTASTVLVISYAVFVMQSRETPLGPPPKSDEQPVDEPRRRLNELWAELQREDDAGNGTADDTWADEPLVDHIPVVMPVAGRAGTPARVDPTPVGAPARRHAKRRRQQMSAAEAPFEALLWLTFRQAWQLMLILAGICFIVGLLIPAHGDVLWPLATLALGVGCGVAAFAAEQRDLSYQYLAAAHLPLRSVWRFKIGFWLLTAIVATAMMAFGALVLVFGRAMLTRIPAGAAVRLDIHLGTLRDLMGTVPFFSVWLLYGFATGQLIVWLCRKSVLALLLSALISAGALGLWLPSVLCRGMSGWQLLLPPLIALAAGHVLVRAWAGGRIKERRPLVALAGFAAAVLAWAGLNFGYRAVEIPNVGMPVDREAYRDALPAGDANAGGLKVQEALAMIDRPLEGKKDDWHPRMDEALRLPVGTIETPRKDGQAPTLGHLPGVSKMTEALRRRATDAQGAGKPVRALDDLAQMLVLSRTLRNKAPLAGYLAGVATEQSALDGVDLWLAHEKPAPAHLARLLDDLNRHAAQVPTPRDCLEGEAYRAAGMLEIPTIWSLNTRGAADRIPEPWLARGVVLSLEIPWEAERRDRLWQLVWAGLFRAIETPNWDLPEGDAAVPGSEGTRAILHGWLPAAGGPSTTDVARLLEASWLTDARLFAPVVTLRNAATKSRWRVDSTRLAVALARYRLDTGRPAATLDALVPQYLPALPVDPYSGVSFRYRVSTGEHIDLLGHVRAGQGVVWSTGPDRRDHGARQHGGRLNPDNAEWANGAFDLITLVPEWR
jgi:hypothetical protein